jgi:hypothetical protein
MGKLDMSFRAKFFGANSTNHPQSLPFLDDLPVIGSVGPLALQYSKNTLASLFAETMVIGQETCKIVLSRKGHDHAPLLISADLPHVFGESIWFGTVQIVPQNIQDLRLSLITQQIVESTLFEKGASVFDQGWAAEHLLSEYSILQRFGPTPDQYSKN